VSEDKTVCCFECQAINGLWPRMQLARSILQHRSPNAETVALALRALDGHSIERLSGELPTVPEPKEAD
jgi:hypothetical protein